MKPWLSDWAITAYCVVVSILIAATAVPQWWLFVLGHGAIVAAAWALVKFDRPGIIGFLRCFDALVYVPVVFLMAMLVVHRVNPHDCDGLLGRIDASIGGIALLRAMKRIETSWLTDLAKLAWMSYYPLPLVAAIPLFIRGRAAFVPLKNALVLGWVVSYLCYFAMPAVGPGNRAEELGVPQPAFAASVISSTAKSLIFAAEAPEPRHTFPSGHTIIAVIVGWHLLRHRRGRPWLLIGVQLALGVVLSTIYLRYHYVVDVLVGIVIAAGCIALTHRRDEPLEVTA